MRYFKVARGGHKLANRSQKKTVVKYKPLGIMMPQGLTNDYHCQVTVVFVTNTYCGPPT